jgi:BolA protein
MIRDILEQKLLDGLQPQRMSLVNESGNHSVPKGSETHWNLIIVSEVFDGKSLMQRHRAVYGALGDTMQKIHALTMKTLTPAEWEAAGGEVTNPAPPCMGGSKKH